MDKLSLQVWGLRSILVAPGWNIFLQKYILAIQTVSKWPWPGDAVCFPNTAGPKTQNLFTVEANKAGEIIGVFLFVFVWFSAAFYIIKNYKLLPFQNYFGFYYVQPIWFFWDCDWQFLNFLYLYSIFLLFFSFLFFHFNFQRTPLLLLNKV